MMEPEKNEDNLLSTKKNPDHHLMNLHYKRLFIFKFLLLFCCAIAPVFHIQRMYINKVCVYISSSFRLATFLRTICAGDLNSLPASLHLLYHQRRASAMTRDSKHVWLFKIMIRATR
uniref:Uncharacterized protein n=1 Tax=Tetranychus urticae TaxID=32264 RepID=T1K1N2_TETUR